jgi:hypothetical protein
MHSRTFLATAALVAGLPFTSVLRAAETPTSPTSPPTPILDNPVRGAFLPPPPPIGALPVKIAEVDGKMRVELGGKLFTEYVYQDTPRPYCYPLLGVDETPMTRNFPMKKVEGEETDHKHHRSLWFTHGSVNGIDFWTEDKAFGKIVHKRFLKTISGQVGMISTENEWIGPDGKAVYVDFEITIRADHGELTFGDTKEGSFAVRLAESMRLKQPKGQPEGKGHIINREGVRDDKTWGVKSPWVYYYGPVGEKTVGVAIFDNPMNPRFPTWWHVRDYGLFAANPFGVHDFEKREKGTGDMKIPSGQSVTFRYRVVLTEGDEKAANIEGQFQRYTGDAKTR